MALLLSASAALAAGTAFTRQVLEVLHDQRYIVPFTSPLAPQTCGCNTPVACTGANDVLLSCEVTTSPGMTSAAQVPVNGECKVCACNEATVTQWFSGQSVCLLFP
jgi:hypothetical protein